MIGLTPEVEARIKDQVWERMHLRLGDEYLETHADFLEAQWEWCVELGILDAETDLMAER